MNGLLAPREYPAHHTETRCFTIGNNKSVDFRLENRKNEKVTLSTADCVNYLVKEVAACGNGGETVYSDWKMKFVLAIQIINSSCTNYTSF